MIPELGQFALSLALCLALASSVLGTVGAARANETWMSVALGMGKISVGPPYFETVFVSLMVPALFFMGVGPLARWKSAPLPELAVRLRWAAALSVLVALVLPGVLGHWSWGVSGGLSLAAWIAATTLLGVSTRARSSAGATLLARLASSSRSYYGMVIAHLGIAVFVVGVTLVKGYGTENDLRMEPGDTTELAGYAFRFGGVREVEGPNYLAVRGTLEVTRNGKPVTVLHPEKRVYTVQQNPMTEAAIDTGFTRDLYVALGDAVSDTAWVVRVQHKPFVIWIWGGCLVMALGGALAISDRRYRIASLPLAAQSALQDGAAPAPAR